MAPNVNAGPMLATPSTPAGNRTPMVEFEHLMDLGTWSADVKMDGIRAWARWDGSQLTLTNRNGIDITRKFPELVADAPARFDVPVWLDGEIVCDSGRFEDTLTRDKQQQDAAITAHAASHPVSFWAFDMPMYHDQAYTERRYELTVESDGWADDDLTSRFKIVPTSYDRDFLTRTRDAGLEGVIAKRNTSLYEFGARSKSWVKYKTVRRLTCLASGYSPGTGHRTHFGAMHLALIKDGVVVNVGRVGTGFTTAQTWELKELLDKGEMLVVEIEALNRTGGDQLRFPVFKGVRCDVNFTACTFDQLDEFPRC